MILSRVLPLGDFWFFNNSTENSSELDEEVQMMLKASICNLNIDSILKPFSSDQVCIECNVSNNSCNQMKRIFQNQIDETTGICKQLSAPNNEISTNTVACMLNKETTESSLYSSPITLCISDDRYLKYTIYDKYRQPGKFDLFEEKIQEDAQTSMFELNQSLIVTNNQDKDDSSFQKAPKEGFKICSQAEKKSSIFCNKRDDLFYKTFGRDVRKFLQDDFTEYTKYCKENKGKGGVYFYQCLVKYATYMNFHKNTNISIESIVCYLGSLINHREFKKACPSEMLELSYDVYNTFNLFTKERLYKLCCSDEFKIFFLYYATYVNEDNYFLRLTNHKTISGNLDPYLYVYKEFCRVCLNKFN